MRKKGGRRRRVAAFKRKFVVDKGKWLWPLHTRKVNSSPAPWHPGPPSRSGIIYNLSVVNAEKQHTVGKKTVWRMLQKEATIQQQKDTTFKQLNAH